MGISLGFESEALPRGCLEEAPNLDHVFRPLALHFKVLLLLGGSAACEHLLKFRKPAQVSVPDEFLDPIMSEIMVRPLVG